MHNLADVLEQPLCGTDDAQSNNDALVFFDELNSHQAHPHASAVSYAQLQHLVALASSSFDAALPKESIPLQLAVAIACPPSPAMIVALLSVMKCHRPFFPLNSSSNTFKHEQLVPFGACALIVHSSLLHKCELATAPLQPVSLELHLAVLPVATLDVALVQRIVSQSQPGDIAYWIRTSGTTSITPSIVRVPHKCILPNITAIRDILRVDNTDTMFLASPLTFDPSIIEIFVCLASRARLVIVPDSLKLQSAKLARALFELQRVSVLMATPSLIRRFGSTLLQDVVLSGTSSCRALVMGGEPYPSAATLLEWWPAASRARLFNIYGTTEVSCWATIHEVSRSELQPGCDKMLLGHALLDTDLIVRDPTSNEPVEHGQGELFIGGPQRVCFVNDETAPPAMRSTGDIVSISTDVNSGDVQLYWMSRKDRRVKRLGHFVNLDETAQTAQRTFAWQAAYVVSDSTHDQDSISSGDLLACFYISPNEIDLPATSDLQQQLVSVLPSHAIPDAFVRISAPPITSNGKVDYKKLLLLVPRTRTVAPVNTSLSATETPQDLAIAEREFPPFVQQSIQQLLPTSQKGKSEIMNNLLWICSKLTHFKAILHIDSYFLRMVCSPWHTSFVDFAWEHTLLDLGGDSVLVVLLANMICDFWTQHSFQFPPNTFDFLVEALMSSPLAIVAERIIAAAREKSHVKTFVNDPESCGSDFVGKRRRVAMHPEPSLPVESTTASIEKRGISVLATADAVSLPFCCQRRRTQHAHCRTQAHADFAPGIAISNARVNWSYNLGKCNDSSPLIVLDHTTSARSRALVSFVIMSSHSHGVACLELHTGAQIWRVELPDRIESSAVLSRCGRYVIVGCYDGGLYFLNIDSGSVAWVYETRDCVKSSPCVSTDSNHVYVGSHDGFVHAVDADSLRMCWKFNPVGTLKSNSKSSAIFSSPTLSIDCKQLFCGTLSGLVFCLDLEPQDTSGVATNCHSYEAQANHSRMLWSYQCEGAVFSSPAIHHASNRIFVSCVNSTMHCFATTGQPLWTFQTAGQIYSSAAIACDIISFGCHDGRVYVLDLDGNKLVDVNTGAPVFSSPAVLNCIEPLFVACNIDGRVIVIDKHARILAEMSLPDQIFSSPVFAQGQVVVGCRDDCVYSLALVGE